MESRQRTELPTAMAMSRLGDSMHTKFRELSRQSMSTDEFWSAMAEFTLNHIRLVEPQELRPPERTP